MVLLTLTHTHTKWWFHQQTYGEMTIPLCNFGTPATTSSPRLAHPASVWSPGWVSVCFPPSANFCSWSLLGMPYSPPVSQCWSCGTRWVFTKQSHSEFKGQPGEHDKYRIADLTKVISPTSDYDTMIPSAAPVGESTRRYRPAALSARLAPRCLKGGSMICWTMLQDASSRFESSYSMKVNCQSNVCSFGLQHQTLDTYYLVGGFNPSEKYESLLGWLFPIYGNIKKVPTHPPVLYFSHRPTWFTEHDFRAIQPSALRPVLQVSHLGNSMWTDMQKLHRDKLKSRVWTVWIQKTNK